MSRLGRQLFTVYDSTSRLDSKKDVAVSAVSSLEMTLHDCELSSLSLFSHPSQTFP
jgi:hypothetical protein